MMPNTVSDVWIKGQMEWIKLLSDLSQSSFTRIAEHHRDEAKKRMEAASKLGLKTAMDASPQAAMSYMRDAFQRSILTLDVLRQRGDAYVDHAKAGLPPVLDFPYDVILEGSTLEPASNYTLLRIRPPEGVKIDPKKRPFMIIDPRAGHGAGIGGFKPESQVGEAFEEGHAVYFVAFNPLPEQGQTLAVVRDTEIAFLDEIARLHPDAHKPVVIGNCQGGWASMILASKVPDKVGPLAINGAPMSYWAGECGKNPMRYTGGLVGGVTPALLMSDLGNGLFDGALLVQNFEQLNPANTYWKKLYSLYANVDTEADRYLEFERWWGGFFMMTEAEIRWIVENLFVGNKLGFGQAILGKELIDLKAIKTPIIIFASHGDNITPPQQALNWLADLYRDENEIKVRGQRIVYMVHPSIGHLGIFVSAKIAGREHDAITDTMEAIEALPPGLYEMVLEEGSDRVHIKFAPRRMADILSLDDGRADEEMFAAVDQISTLNAKVYDTFVRPFLKPLVNEQSAKAFFDSRPLRMERSMISSENPMLGWLPSAAEAAKMEREKPAANNAYAEMERAFSAQIEQTLNFTRDVRDAYQEMLFHAIYAHPILRMVGAQAVAERNSKAEQNLAELPEVRAALAKLENGSEAEGAIRILELLARTRSYVRRSHLERATRVFEDTEPFCSMTDTELAAKIHEQALIVQFAPDAALNTLPVLLDTMQERTRALDVVMEIAGPFESMHPDVRVLYKEIEAMLLPARAAMNMQPANSDLVPSSEENDEESAPFLYHQAPTQPDDLILIKGIGPKLNKLLNQIGIYTFAQIAAWTEAEVAWVNEKIDFPGRIQREEWISQARALNVEKHAAE